MAKAYGTPFITNQEVQLLQRRISYGGRKGKRAFHRILPRRSKPTREGKVIQYWRMLRALTYRYPNREDIINSDIRRILRRPADSTSSDYVANPYALPKSEVQ